MAKTAGDMAFETLIDRGVDAVGIGSDLVREPV